MPIYQYLCPTCNHKFELRQSYSDDGKISCPKCNNGARRVFVPVPIIFKGSGFYVTDSSKKSEVQDTPKETLKETKSETKSETRSEAKVEAKAEKKEQSPAAKAS